MSMQTTQTNPNQIKQREEKEEWVNLMSALMQRRRGRRLVLGTLGDDEEAGLARPLVL